MPIGSHRESLLAEMSAQAHANVIEMNHGPVVIPVIADCLTMDRRVVDRGRVLITKKVEEHTEHVEVAPLWHEEVNVEHVPLGHFVEVAPSPYYEGDTLVLPVVEEVIIVEKRLRLREEVRVTRRQVHTAAPAQDLTLRSETLEVERLSAEPAGNDTLR